MSSGRDPLPDCRLTSVQWGRTACPLSTPYSLSFTTLSQFDTIWVSIEDEVGAIGVGEAVPLPGYGSETVESVEQIVAHLCDGARTANELRARCAATLPEHPFAASAVLTALDLPAYLKLLQPEARIPLNAPLAGDAAPEILARQLDEARAAGCRYLKVKVGRDVDAESRNARWLLTTRTADTFRLVFDANQAYTVDEGLTLARTLSADPHRRLLWFEQPVDRHDWTAMERVCRESAVPIVLDEPIYTAADIDRAWSIGASGVKLKLCKHGGIADTLNLAEHAHARGLTVVFGNGVATDIGNFAELLVMLAGSALFAPPSESSGFAKLVTPLCDLGLTIAGGYQLHCRLDAAAARERLASFSASVRCS